MGEERVNDQMLSYRLNGIYPAVALVLNVMRYNTIINPTEIVEKLIIRSKSGLSIDVPIRDLANIYEHNIIPFSHDFSLTFDPILDTIWLDFVFKPFVLTNPSKGNVVVDSYLCNYDYYTTFDHWKKSPLAIEFERMHN